MKKNIMICGLALIMCSLCFGAGRQSQQHTGGRQSPAGSPQTQHRFVTGGVSVLVGGRPLVAPRPATRPAAHQSGSSGIIPIDKRMQSVTMRYSPRNPGETGSPIIGANGKPMSLHEYVINFDSIIDAKKTSPHEALKQIDRALDALKTLGNDKVFNDVKNELFEKFQSTFERKLRDRSWSFDGEIGDKSRTQMIQLIDTFMKKSLGYDVDNALRSVYSMLPSQAGRPTVVSRPATSRAATHQAGPGGIIPIDQRMQSVTMRYSPRNPGETGSPIIGANRQPMSLHEYMQKFDDVIDSGRGTSPHEALKQIDRALDALKTMGNDKVFNDVKNELFEKFQKTFERKLRDRSWSFDKVRQDTLIEVMDNLTRKYDSGANDALGNVYDMRWM